ITFNGEVLVESSNYCSLRFGDHGVERRLGNCAAAGDGRQASAAPRTKFTGHAVAMDVSPVSPTASRNAFRERLENCVVCFAREIAVGVGVSHQSEEFVLVPAAAV